MHEVRTVPQMGWAGIKDGQLLELAESEFDVFITVDRNLPFEQNLSKLALIIVIVEARSNRLSDLKPLSPKILKIIGTAQQGQANRISG